MVLSAHLTDARSEYLRELGVKWILEKLFEVADLLTEVKSILG